MADLTLSPCGDKELHVAKIKLAEGEGVIPLYVQVYRSNKQEFAKIAPAVGLYAEQATRLEYHFSVHNEWKRKDVFLIQRRHLSRLTERVNGITPSYYYRWPGKDVPVISEKLKVNGEEISPIPDDAEDFFEYVHKKRAIDRNVLRLAWAAMSKEAVGWMLKRKKPINLGFVTLHAVPYRANWKEILLARFPNALWWFQHNVNKEGGFKDRLVEAEFQHELTNISLMAIHGRDNFIHWTMEAVPSDQWEDDVAEHEMLKKSGGNTQYVRHHEKTISDLVPRILEIFTAYVKKTARPFPKISCGTVDGSQKLVPYRGKQDILPKFGTTIPVRIVTPSGPPKIGYEDQHQPVSPTFVKGLQNLPRFLPAPDDVRRSVEQREVAKPADGTNGEDRLRLPNDSQGDTAREQVLAEHNDERPSGVDQAIDI